MQQIAKPTPDRGNSQTQTVLITALFLFALAGGIMGFAVGAFAHPRQSQQQQTNTTPKMQATQPVATPQPSPTTTPATVPLGFPLFHLQSGTPGITQTVYTVQATKENTQIPLTESGITCHLAFVKGNGRNAPNIDSKQFQVPNAQNNNLQEEIPNILQFDPGTQEIQPCQNGQGTWKVTINTANLKRGRYYSLVGLTVDSLHYNFSYAAYFLNKEGVLEVA